jgi:predicted nucleic acid-binding protein
VTSRLGAKHVAVVAADANVLLSAVLGHAALKVFTQSDVIVLTTSRVLEEVRDYLPVVAKQYDILPHVLEAQFRLLALRECGPEDYASKLEDAKRAIGGRDPDDVDLLALALAFDAPVWSNDSDFKDAGVEWYTTARLLRGPGISGAPR